MDLYKLNAAETFDAAIAALIKCGCAVNYYSTPQDTVCLYYPELPHMQQSFVIKYGCSPLNALRNCIKEIESTLKLL